MAEQTQQRDFHDEDLDDDSCHRCGGEGFVEYNDAPEAWGEDCPSEMNHLVTCPICLGRGTAQ